MEGNRFSWGSSILASVGVGAMCTIAFLLLGATLRVATKFFEILLWPGFATGIYTYGGMHGGEPVVLSLVVNIAFYAALALLAALVKHTIRSRKQNPPTGSALRL